MTRIKQFGEFVNEAENKEEIDEASATLPTMYGDDDKNDKNFDAYLKRNNIKMKIVTPIRSTAGGWPEIKYTGSKEALTKMAKERFKLEADELKDLFD